MMPASSGIAILAVLLATSAVSAQITERRVAPPDSVAGGYFIVDSDDPAGAPWRPVYAFLDTTYQRSSWHRVYPGPQSIDPGHPGAVYWQSIGGDTTDNTFAGPIPIGFPFNFYGVNYDSVFLSSNGYIGFGSFTRASGGDGPTYSSFSPGVLPNLRAPKSIVAFLMTDAEMVRTKFDSSRVLYRTSPTNDSLFITIYNIYHISDASVLNTLHKFRATVQIVLTRSDSAVTFRYVGFNGSWNVALQAGFSATVFREGCFSERCSHAAVIGIQDATQSFGATYMANGAFTAPGSATELHGGLAVSFRRFENQHRVVAVTWPEYNREFMAGDTIDPSASFKNLSATSASFTGKIRIRNATTGRVLFVDTVAIDTLAPGATRSIAFAPWHSDSIDPGQRGALLVDAIATTHSDSGIAFNDAWPFDDTVSQPCFVLARLAGFSDFNNDFSGSPFLSGTIPNTSRWVNHGAAVVDGDVFTYQPPPARGRQGDPSFTQLNSPVIMMDRRDASGREYDRCAFGSGGPIGNGGTGDTIISFPIDLRGWSNPILAFSYERSGKKTYPRWYDLGTAIGPERTVTNPEHTQVFRAGDSLEVDFANVPSAGTPTNVASWREAWAADGRKDFNFNRVYLPIDSAHATSDFRFRVRLKAKNDFEPGQPGDDYDEWYLDNFVVVSPKKPEIEVSYTRLGQSWMYEKVPASQAETVPVEARIANNGGFVTNAFGLAMTVMQKYSIDAPVYARLITVPVIGSGKSMLIAAPSWNARQAGPGRYVLSTYIVPKGYDSESQNDSTYDEFTLAFDSSYVYDNGVNDIPGFFQLSGIGLSMPENDPANPIGGGAGSGSLAVKFTVFLRDTSHGAQLWFGSWNQAPDSILIRVLTSNGATPGEPITSTCASIATVRTGPWDSFSTYRFSCGPVVLDPGEYWMSASQLGASGMQLGGAAYRSSCDWVVRDPTGGGRDSFVVNDPAMSGLFAYENEAASGIWQPFFFPNGEGKPAFGYADSLTAMTRSSRTCGASVPYFLGEGSWIPMIRPYFGVRPFGPRYYDCDHCEGYITVDASHTTFDTSGDCTHPSKPSQVTIPLRYYGDQLSMTFTCSITGRDTADFAIVGNPTITLSPAANATTANLVIKCTPSAPGVRMAVLHFSTGSLGSFSMNDIPLRSGDDGPDIIVPLGVVDFGGVFVGNVACRGIRMLATGGGTDTIVSLTTNPPVSSVVFTPSMSILQPGVPDTLWACFSPTAPAYLATTLTITTSPCNRTHTVQFTGSGERVVSVAQSSSLPLRPVLEQNHPNPFTGATTIAFTLPTRSHARLAINDVLGRECAVVCDDDLDAGRHIREVRGSLAPGPYVYSLIAGSSAERRLMMVAR